MAPTVAQRAPAPESHIDRGRIGETAPCLDNDANILGGMTILLQGWGCEVLAAVDLAGAVAAVRGGTRAPSGLLVDYHLERSNGIEAIRALRRQLDPDLPAALITADRSAEIRDAARALGIAHARQAAQAGGAARDGLAMGGAAARCRGVIARGRWPAING